MDLLKQISISILVAYHVFSINNSFILLVQVCWNTAWNWPYEHQYQYPDDIRSWSQSTPKLKRPGSLSLENLGVLRPKKWSQTFTFAR